MRFIFVLFFSVSAFADGKITFDYAYTDQSNGLEWSKSLPGRYSHGCVFGTPNCQYDIGPTGERQIVVESSDAAKACRDINARLPTDEEVQSLLRQFDYTGEESNPQLTVAGVRKMYSLFDNNGGSWYWSASGLPYGSTRYGIQYGYGYESYSRATYTEGSVRCVREN